MKAFITMENGFGIFIIYEFALVIFSVIILLFSTLRFYNRYKNQVYFLIVAAIFPLSTSILYVFKIIPIKADLTPTALIFSELVLELEYSGRES